jgi:hypothetical protein
MKIDDATLDALIDANITWLNLKVDPEWRPAIKESLVAISGAIVAVETFSLPDEAELAPAFEP